MKLDKVEQARARHSADGFCQVIGCPECEVRRQERFGGKVLDKVRVEVVEGGKLDFELNDLRREHVLLLAENRQLGERLERANFALEAQGEVVNNLHAQLAESAEVIAEYTAVAMEANERARALGAEICGFVGAYLDVVAAADSIDDDEFLGLLVNLALVKLHDASHRLAPVQPS